VKAKICVIACILAIVSAFISCATNKDAAKNVISLGAKRTSDGVILYFPDIPKNTVRMRITFLDTNIHYQIPTYVDIQGSELSKLKTSETLFYPLDKNDHEYIFLAFYEMDGYVRSIFHDGLNGPSQRMGLGGAIGTIDSIRQLYFDYIPYDTVFVRVLLFDISTNFQIPAYVDVQGNKLSELKRSKVLHYPVVKNRHGYHIVVLYYTGTEGHYSFSGIDDTVWLFD